MQILQEQISVHAGDTSETFADSKISDLSFRARKLKLSVIENGISFLLTGC
jgi:hypothetical protein